MKIISTPLFLCILVVFLSRCYSQTIQTYEDYVRINKIDTNDVIYINRYGKMIACKYKIEMSDTQKIWLTYRNPDTCCAKTVKGGIVDQLVWIDSLQIETKNIFYVDDKGKKLNQNAIIVSAIKRED